MKCHPAWPIVCAAMLLSTSLAAHHSFEGTFDRNQPRRLDGTVVGIEWRNPHAYIALRVADAARPGTSSVWRVELAGAEVLSRTGWTAGTLRAGMEIGVDGFSDRNGRQVLGGAAVTITATGQTLTTPTNWMPPGAAR